MGATELSRLNYTINTFNLTVNHIMNTGGDIRRAKFHNNVISPLLLDIPLDQVKLFLRIEIIRSISTSGLHSWTPHISWETMLISFLW